jgi:Lrp/AsnC family leucine-responsive transcriptional regulator
MKFSRSVAELDAADRAILELLQDNCKQPLAAIGAKVGLSAPAVVDRIHKLEEAGVITGYAAVLDARRLGMDVTAFIGVTTDLPGALDEVEREVVAIDEVLECHHVTGAHSLMLKVKTRSTETLEELIERIRGLGGVARTETMVVLSSHFERARIAFSAVDEPEPRAARRNGARRPQGAPISGRRGART